MTESLRLLSSCGDREEAEALRALLAAHEIPAVVQGGESRAVFGMLGALIEVRVLVPDAAFERAQELLASVPEEVPERAGAAAPRRGRGRDRGLPGARARRRPQLHPVRHVPLHRLPGGEPRARRSARRARTAPTIRTVAAAPGGILALLVIAPGGSAAGAARRSPVAPLQGVLALNGSPLPIGGDGRPRRLCPAAGSSPPLLRSRRGRCADGWRRRWRRGGWQAAGAAMAGEGHRVRHRAPR